METSILSYEQYLLLKHQRIQFSKVRWDIIYSASMDRDFC